MGFNSLNARCQDIQPASPPLKPVKQVFPPSSSSCSLTCNGSFWDGRNALPAAKCGTPPILRASNSQFVTFSILIFEIRAEDIIPKDDIMEAQSWKSNSIWRHPGFLEPLPSYALPPPNLSHSQILIFGTVSDRCKSIWWHPGFLEALLSYMRLLPHSLYISGSPSPISQSPPRTDPRFLE